MKSSFPQDLRHIIQGILITWAILGAIATAIGTIYLLLVIILARQGSLFQGLIIPGIEPILILSAVIQVVFWFTLSRLRLISRQAGNQMAGLMVGICIFIMLGSLLIPR